MPFIKSQPEDRSELRDLVYGWGKVITRRAFGEAGPGLDLDFDSIESLAVDMAQTLTRGTIEEILRIQFQLLGDQQPCPQCSRSCPVQKAARTLAVRGGTIDYEEPTCHCPACRRDFFPSAPQLATRCANCSPAILGKISREAARSTSFEAAGESLSDLAEVDISGRQVGRIAHELGAQLRQERDQQSDDFQCHRLVPQTTVAPKLAVVSIDGGRFQVRSEGRGLGVHDPAWREDKVADLVTMSTPSHDQDPHPDLPRCFTKKKDVVELVQGVTSQGALADLIAPTAEEPVPLTVFEPAEDEPDRSWPPEPPVRTCQATTCSSEAFGPMVAAERCAQLLRCRVAGLPGRRWAVDWRPPGILPNV